MTPLPLPLLPPPSAGLGSESTALEASTRDAPGGWLGHCSPCRGGLSAGDVVTVLGRRGEYRVEAVHRDVVSVLGDDGYRDVPLAAVRRAE